MSKSMTFGEKDAELVKRIIEFQKNKGLDSFAEAVRTLCKSGLQVNEIIKNNK